MPAFVIALLSDFAASFAKDLIIGTILSVLFKIGLVFGIIFAIFKIANIQVNETLPN